MTADEILAAIRWQPARPVLTVVGCHAGGEIGNVVVAGVDPPAGATVFEQMEQIRADDSIRRLLLHEPRGSVAVHSNIVLPSLRPDCAFGYVIMEPTEYAAMSGSNTICTATVLLETGMVPMVEPVTTFRLEAPGGVVEITAGCRDGKAQWIEIENVPCFADRIDAPLEVAGLGTITVDVAYGGMWYAIADGAALGFRFTPDEAADLSRMGTRIHTAAREQLHPVHPANPEIRDVSIVQLAEPWRGVGQVTKNAVVVAPGRLDRSATGTGLSARLAALHARGDMRVEDSMTHASVIGSTFDGRIVREVSVGGRPGIVPAIRGTAWITGVTHVLVDRTDPFPEGYLLSDTWPGDDIQA
ncbi:MAG TPA: proline racemase family protein [Candidatus Limnocylindrales bacterium]|nr:proline racemase family protein [Candidatus Limnocylindrales bacterium]